jgi:sec-independent protein translocase protein TatB
MGEIFGIGIEELVFIGILLALLFGPESIPRLARSAGRLLNRLFRSPLYRESLHIRKQIRDMPTALARLAQLEEMQHSLNDEIRDLKAAIEVDTKQAPGAPEAAQTIQPAPDAAATPPPPPPGEAAGDAQPDGGD